MSYFTNALKEKLFMTLVKDSKTDFIQGTYYMEFCVGGQRLGSTPNTTRISGNL